MKKTQELEDKNTILNDILAEVIKVKAIVNGRYELSDGDDGKDPFYGDCGVYAHELCNRLMSRGFELEIISVTSPSKAVAHALVQIRTPAGKFTADAQSGVLYPWSVSQMVENIELADDYLGVRYTTDASLTEHQALYGYVGKALFRMVDAVEFNSSMGTGIGENLVTHATVEVLKGVVYRTSVPLLVQSDLADIGGDPGTIALRYTWPKLKAFMFIGILPHYYTQSWPTSVRVEILDDGQTIFAHTYDDLKVRHGTVQIRLPTKLAGNAVVLTLDGFMTERLPKERFLINGLSIRGINIDSALPA